MSHPTERVLGGLPTVGDLLNVVFASNTTFLEGEFVLVPRSRGGFTYGVVEGAEQRTQSCPLDSAVRHVLPEYSVMLDESQELLKGLPAAFLGKLPEVETGEEEDDEDDEEQVIGGKALQRDLRTMIFGTAHEGLMPGELVLVPRSRGGFTYGRIYCKQSVPCHLSERPKHIVEGLRILLSEDADPTNCLRKDVALQLLGKIPKTPAPGLLRSSFAGKRSFPSMRLTPSGLKQQPMGSEPSAPETCGDCEEAEAAYECEDCGEFYCEPCCSSVHSKGNRRNHTRINLLATAQGKLTPASAGSEEEPSTPTGQKAKKKKKKVRAESFCEPDDDIAAALAAATSVTGALPVPRPKKKSYAVGVPTMKPNAEMIGEEGEEEALRQALIAQGLISVEEETVDSEKFLGSAAPSKKKKKKKKASQNNSLVPESEETEAYTERPVDQDPIFKTITARLEVNLRVPIDTTLEDLIKQISNEMQVRIAQLTDFSDSPITSFDSIQSGDVVRVHVDKMSPLQSASDETVEKQAQAPMYGARLVRKTTSKLAAVQRSESGTVIPPPPPEDDSGEVPPPPLEDADGSSPSPAKLKGAPAKALFEKRASKVIIPTTMQSPLLDKLHQPKSEAAPAAKSNETVVNPVVRSGSLTLPISKEENPVLRAGSMIVHSNRDNVKEPEKEVKPKAPEKPTFVELTSHMDGYPDLSESQLKAFVRLQANIRRFLQVRRYRAMVKRHVHRRKVVFELLATERSFMKCLRTITEVFMTPIQQAVNTSKKILTQQEIMTVFGVIDCLADMQKRFWKALEKRVLGWDEKPINEQCVGDLFYPPQQKKAITVAYTTYITSHKLSSAFIAEHLKNKSSAFYHFMQDQANQEICEGLGMESFLITPVQRICRYVLLLTDLLKNTEPDHPDSENIANALETTKDIASMINEKQRSEDSQVELKKVAELFPAATREELHLVQPHRMLIAEGPVTELIGKEVKRRWIILMNDMLLCTTKKKNKYTLEWKVDLANAVCVEHVNAEGGDLEIRELKIALTYPFVTEINYTITPPGQPPQDFSFWKEKFHSVMTNPELLKRSWNTIPSHLGKNLLSEKDWSMIMNNAQMITYSKDQPILHQGSRLMRFYRVISGRVRMEHQVGTTRTVVRILEVGEFFGEKFFVDEQILLPVHVLADSATTVVSSIGFNEMANMLAMYPQLCVRFFQLVCVKLSKPQSAIQQNRIVSDVTIGKKPAEKKKSQQATMTKGDSKKKMSNNSKISKKFKLPESQIDPETHYVCCLKGRQFSQRMPGKLYLFPLYICFSAKMFGRETKVAVPFAEVKSVDIQDNSIFIFADEPYELVFEKELPEEAKLFILTAWKAQKQSTGTATTPRLHKDDSGAGALALSTEDWEKVYACAVQMTYKKNERILTQGERPYRIYHISKGVCRVEMTSPDKDKGGAPIVVGKMQTNQMFGELSYMFGGCAKVTVIADQDGVEVYYLERSSLEKIFAEKPLLGGKFYKFIAEQMASEVERSSP